MLCTQHGWYGTLVACFVPAIGTYGWYNIVTNMVTIYTNNIFLSQQDLAKILARPDQVLPRLFQFKDLDKKFLARFSHKNPLF